jgi:ATP synthase protein I
MPTSADGPKSPKGDLSPEEKARFERKLSDLGQRLDKATGGPATSKAGDKAVEEAANAARSKAMGLGFSIAAQLVAGVIVGGGIGYLLDRWLGTVPWLMVLFLGFGFAAGIMNVVRTAREMQKISEQQSKGAKSMPDDADDDK